MTNSLSYWAIFSFYHTDKPCHTERSEVSINIKYGFFATLKMTKRRGKAKANAFCPNSPTNFSKFFLKLPKIPPNFSQIPQKFFKKMTQKRKFMLQFNFRLKFSLLNGFTMSKDLTFTTERTYDEKTTSHHHTRAF